MKVIDAVKKLQRKGFNITFYKRKDGGYLVKSINGKKFTGAKGNLKVRSLAGGKVYTKQLKANRVIAKVYNTSLSKRIWTTNPDKLHGEELFKRAHREWKKALKGGFLGSGKVTLKKYQYNLSHKTIEETERLLRENIRYSSGLAYTENVNALRQEFEDMKGLNDTQQEKVNQIIELLNNKGDRLTENQVQHIREMQYDARNHVETGVTFNDFLNYTLKILKKL